MRCFPFSSAAQLNTLTRDDFLFKKEVDADDADGGEREALENAPGIASEVVSLVDVCQILRTVRSDAIYELRHAQLRVPFRAVFASLRVALSAR